MKKTITTIKKIAKGCKTLAIVGVFGLIPMCNNAQTLNYNFSQQNGTYSAITGTLLSSGSLMDDATFAYTLPFTFNFNGTNYTNIYVSENGYVSFGSTDPGTTCRLAISSAISGFQIASPMSADLQGINATSDLRISVVGVAPYRKFTAQWTNLQFYLGSGQSFNFQITLDETTNFISYIYGVVSNTGIAGSLQVGLRGNTNANFQNRTSTTNWTTSVFGVSNTNAMTINSTVSPTVGLTYVWTASGAALNFDGTSDNVSLSTAISTSLAGSSALTVEAWIRPTTSAGNGEIVCNHATQHQFYFLRNPSNGLDFVISPGSVSAPAGTATLNIWQHVAAVFNGSNMKIYVNGSLASSSTITPMVLSTISPTQTPLIGTDGFNNNFGGDIDEVRIWKRALCQGEIQNNMNGEIPTSAPGLIANYHFNQGVAAAANSTVTSLTDASGNNYTGTLNTFSLTGSTSNWITPGGVVSGSSVTPFVSPTVAISGGNSICSGSSVTYTASGNVSTYTWTSGPNTSTYVVTPSVTTTYSVAGTATNGCVSNMATTTLSVNTTPTISVNNGTICSGNSFTITPTGASTYTIQGGSFVVSPTTNANYTVAGTSTAGCVSANTATSSITVNSLPTISVTTSNSIICGPPYQGTTTINASGATTYTWNTSATGSSIAVTPSVTTNYTVTGTDVNGCKNTTTITQSVSACTGIQQLATNGADIVVFPNPNNGSFTVYIQNVNANTKISVMNVIGQVILSSTPSDEKTQINLQGFDDGVYFVRIINNDMTISLKKIIKQ